MKRWKDKGQTGAWLLNSTQGPAHLQRGQWCPRWGSLPFGVEAERAMGFPRAQWYGIHLSMQELWVRSLVQEDPLEKELATHPSILAWKPPWTEKHSWTFQYSYSLVYYMVPGVVSIGCDLVTEQQQRDLHITGGGMVWERQEWGMHESLNCSKAK